MRFSAAFFTGGEVMEFITLGKTNLMVSRSGLSTRRLELISPEGTSSILDAAYTAGINLYEFSCQSMDICANAGTFFYDKRKNVVISVTSEIQENTNLQTKIDSALGSLYMDYIDVFNIKSDEFIDYSVYSQLEKAKSDGKVKYFGFYARNLELAKKVVVSKLYDVLHYPLNIQSTDEELELVNLCQENDVGLIARMPLAGGKIDNVPIAFGFLKKFENVVPVYSVKDYDEIQKLIYFEENPPVADTAFNEEVSLIRNVV